MTANWRRKRRVRARMAKTGESYTAALRHLRQAEEAHMPTFHLHHAGVTDTGNVRTSNQDQLLAEGDLVAVADGMGGHRGGEVASRLAVDALRARFAEDPTADGLVAAVEAANLAVFTEGQARPELQGMGTTIAAVALVADGSLAVVNVGDSRAYLLQDGQHGELRQLTADHSFVAELVRLGQISEDEARTHPRRNVLTQVLGVEPTIVPYVARTEPARGDRLLLCSDGLFNELDEPDIAAILGAVADPAEAAARLVEEAKRHGGADNITALVLDIA
jgi:PPM family protein phosphatase